MIAIHNYSFESCVCNIFLQNIATEFNKQLSTHFVERVEFPIILKDINKYYIDKEKKSFIWILGQTLDSASFTSLEFVVDQNDHCKFIYVCDSNIDKKQKQMLDILSRNSNFKILCSESRTIPEKLYDFMLSKKYNTSNLKTLLDSTNDANMKYRLKLFFDEFGFYHFKENFIHGDMRHGLLKKADQIVDRRKELLKTLKKRGQLQNDSKTAIAICDDDVLEDILNVTSYSKNVVNMISTKEIKVYCPEVEDFFREIQIEKIFKTEIYHIEFLEQCCLIKIKENVGYNSVLEILQYIHAELDVSR